VETTFLHGELEKGQEIYMDCPEGIPHEEDECMLSQKTIYGLVQSTRQFFKKLVACMKTMGFDYLSCNIVSDKKKTKTWLASYRKSCHTSCVQRIETSNKVCVGHKDLWTENRTKIVRQREMVNDNLHGQRIGWRH
jgi:hypothetical protein